MARMKRNLFIRRLMDQGNGKPVDEKKEKPNRQILVKTWEENMTSK